MGSERTRYAPAMSSEAPRSQDGGGGCQEARADMRPCASGGDQRPGRMWGCQARPKAPKSHLPRATGKGSGVRTVVSTLAATESKWAWTWPSTFIARTNKPIMVAFRYSMAARVARRASAGTWRPLGVKSGGQRISKHSGPAQAANGHARGKATMMMENCRLPARGRRLGAVRLLQGRRIRRRRPAPPARQQRCWRGGCSWWWAHAAMWRRETGKSNTRPGLNTALADRESGAKATSKGARLFSVDTAASPSQGPTTRASGQRRIGARGGAGGRRQRRMPHGASQARLSLRGFFLQ